MKIAILDPRIHAPGLTKLFPGAEYFVMAFPGGRYDLDKTPDKFREVYGFDYREDIDTITGENYDAVFIVYACFDFRQKNRTDVQYQLEKILRLINKSGFPKIIGFSNDDSPFDPSVDCDYLKASVWFKRNYQAATRYAPNVFPFPFVMFGHVCPLWRVLTETHTSPEKKKDRVLWAGHVSKRHSSHRNPDYLSRHEIFNNELKRNVGNEHFIRKLWNYVKYKLFENKLKKFVKKVKLPNHKYMRELSRSKFALDVNGEGDPNNRTFELLTTDALILQQFKHLVWPFDPGEGFPEETIYKTPEEFVEKLRRLRADPILYGKCLANQKYIKEKYFSREWLREYVLKHISS